MIRFVPGMAWAAVAGSRVAVLPADTEPGQVEHTFVALTGETPLSEIASNASHYGSPLVLAEFGTEKLLARRSGVPARVDDTDLAPASGEQLSFETVAGAALLIGDFGRGEDTSFPILCGVTRVRALRVELSDVSLETLLPEDLPESTPEPAPLAGSIIDSVPGFRASTSAAAPRTPAPSAETASSSTPSAPEPSTPAHHAPPVQPAPATPSAPHMPSAPAEATEPDSEEAQWGDAQQLGDHDGNTVRAEDARELIAKLRTQSVPSTSATPPLGGNDSSAQQRDDRPEVLSTICFLGHVNPPSSATCADCGGEIAAGSLQRRPRPDVAAAVMPGGQRIALRSVVVVGRRPRARTPEAQLVRVESPQEDISRSHLELRAEDWNIVAEDLGSTNGTLLLRHGQQPQRLRPEAPAFVHPGDRLDIGEGVIIEVVSA